VWERGGIHTKFWSENLKNLKGRDHSEDLCIDQGPVAGCCECGNEPLGSIKGGEF